RKVGNLISSSERILTGIRNRTDNFDSVDEVNTYFASDMMISKLRETIEKLYEMEQSVQADDLSGRIKALRDETIRKLRDKLELFSEGENVIKFGEFAFNVNTQPLNLTTVFREKDMFFHLTGTDYYEEITDETILSTKDLWDQKLVSENDLVYRGEYLAYKILMTATRNDQNLSIRNLTAASEELDEIKEIVKTYSANLYSEGYDRGIHDSDAAIILQAIIKLYNESGLLRYDSSSRALAIIFWAYWDNSERKDFLRYKMQSFGTIGFVFDVAEMNNIYIDELHVEMINFFEKYIPDAEDSVLKQAAEFLFHELQDQEELLFTINKLANDLYARFISFLKDKGVRKGFDTSIKHLKGDLKGRLDLARDWVATYCRLHEEKVDHLIWEVIALIVSEEDIQHEIAEFSTYEKVEGLLGQHQLISENSLEINFDLFLLKLTNFSIYNVPRFETYLRLRKELTEAKGDTMRLKEFESKVMGSFVRNRLINNVYLPLVGANFAKQLGAAGDNKRTDLMGLLLLVSPPGYGKTTLMEYVANRLGLTFMKINGPAIGHQVTSLDPAEASNATSREELIKLNLSLEMGNNVMIYLDDIQHCNPELLQKFISLCDAQRKIEGVYNGQTRTYDLRGKKV
ncbi:MAG: ATP-binding protein, partial [Lentisphaeria bacterium]|nr:ATP-binding protein [Lentisphaeria bacterium]